MIKYALAYALFQVRDLEGAERQLRGVHKSELFEQGIALRKAIRACRDAGWACNL